MLIVKMLSGGGWTLGRCEVTLSDARLISERCRVLTDV